MMTLAFMSLHRVLRRRSCRTFTYHLQRSAYALWKDVARPRRRRKSRSPTACETPRRARLKWRDERSASARTRA
jgi:hypothetical protein